jgi:hypothetical protein
VEFAVAKDRFDYVLLDDCSYSLFGDVLKKLVASFLFGFHQAYLTTKL